LLGNGVVGFQVVFYNNDGSLTRKFHPDPAVPTDPLQSVAIRVSLVTVARDGLTHLQDTGKLTSLIGYLTLTPAEATETARSPETIWNEKIVAGHASIDRRTLRSIQTAERLYPLSGPE
jgi:hypothetical protein